MALTSNNGNLKVPSTTKSEKRERDTDSDSGISIEISKSPSPRSPIKPIPHEPLTTKEQEKPLPNYTLMVQEAIVALTSGKNDDKNANDNGCSLLGIFLYILHNYSTLESVEIMNEKIRSTLALLKRMGIVQRVDTDEDNDELEYQPKIVNDIKDDLEDDLEIIKVVQPKKNKMEKTESKNLVAKKKVAKILKSNQNAKKPSSPKAGKENSNSQTGTQVIYKPKRLSPALSTICGRKLLTRHDALKAIWKYIKQHKLQDPVQKTIIVCDDKLKAVTKKKRVTSAEILTCLGQHMTTI